MAGVSQRNSKKWRIYWKWKGYERKFASLPRSQYSKKEAESEAYRIENDGPPKEVTKALTFKEFADRFFKIRDIADATKAKALKCVQVFDDYLQTKGLGADVNAVTESLIREYIASRKDVGFSPSSLNVDLSFLKLVFKKLHAEGIFSKNPTLEIKYLKEEKVIKVLPTKEEVKMIFEQVQESEPLFIASVYFEMTRGWRRDELRLMKVDDIDLSGERLYVKNTKTGVQRMERLSAEDCLVLNEHIIRLKNAGLYKSTGYLFPSKKGGLLCKNTLLKKIKQAAKAVGITKNITNHLFRHYVVTSLMDKTGNVEVVKAITGHKDTKTILDHYLHATAENVKRGLEITHIDTGFTLKSVPKSVPKKGEK